MTDLNREEIPSFLYGTAWKEEQTAPLVKMAIAAGFRGIDTANQRKHYFEAAVGEALSSVYEAGSITREELFLQTKFTFLAGQDHRLPYDRNASFSKQVEESFASSLEHLKTEYLDSYVLHGPSQYHGLGQADFEAWAAMEELYKKGKTRALGISNVSADQLRELLESVKEVPLFFVQNRCFARTGWDYEVRRICKEKGIIYQGFSLLTANQRELQRSEVQAIAEGHQKTIPQVVFRFAIEVGMLPLTGTTDEEHMRQDLAALDFQLSQEEVETIEEIGR